MATVLLVTPNAHWCYWTSANLRGSPATHIVDEHRADRTLCGRECEGWMMQDDEEIIPEDRDDLCKPCRRVLLRRMSVPPTGEGAQGEETTA